VRVVWRVVGVLVFCGCVDGEGVRGSRRSWVLVCVRRCCGWGDWSTDETCARVGDLFGGHVLERAAGDCVGSWMLCAGVRLGSGGVLLVVVPMIVGLSRCRECRPVGVCRGASGIGCGLGGAGLSGDCFTVVACLRVGCGGLCEVVTHTDGALRWFRVAGGGTRKFLAVTVVLGDVWIGCRDGR